MHRKLRLPSPAMAVALAALFVALSGTAVAAGVPALAKRALVADNAKKLGGQTPAALLGVGEAGCRVGGGQCCPSSPARRRRPPVSSTVKTARRTLSPQRPVVTSPPPVRPGRRPSAAAIDRPGVRGDQFRHACPAPDVRRWKLASPVGRRSRGERVRRLPRSSTLPPSEARGRRKPAPSALPAC